MLCTYALDIAAPIEKVFDCVDDPDKLKLWLDGLEETTYLTERDPANPVGTKFKQKIREGGRVQEYDGEVTAYEKPKHLGVKIGASGFSVQVDYRFTPISTGTHLDYAADIRCNSIFFRVMIFLFGWLNKRILRKQITKLKELAERQ
jgi:uncharacterized protein YndB with AHSA1/START domain